MYKIAVIGDYDSIVGFRALGFDVFEAQEKTDAPELIKKLALGGEYAVIFLTEELAEASKAEIDEYKDSRLPAIILIPSSRGSLGLGMAGVKGSVERAVGADILFKEE